VSLLNAKKVPTVADCSLADDRQQLCGYEVGVVSHVGMLQRVTQQRYTQRDRSRDEYFRGGGGLGSKFYKHCS